MNYRFLLLLIVCFASRPAIAKASAIVVIQYELSNAGREITFNVPLVDGRYLVHNEYRTVVDPKGKATIKLDLRRAGIIIFDGVQCTPLPCIGFRIWVEPNSSIFIDAREELSFSGSLSRENTLMTKVFGLRGNERWTVSARAAKTPGEILRKRDSLINVSHQLVESIDSTGMSMTFLDFMRTQTRIYYDALTLSSFFNKVADSSLVQSEWSTALTQSTEDLAKDVADGQGQASEITYRAIYYLVELQKIDAGRLNARAHEFYDANALGDRLFEPGPDNEVANKVVAFAEKYPKSAYIKPMQKLMARHAR